MKPSKAFLVNDHSNEYLNDQPNKPASASLEDLYLYETKSHDTETDSENGHKSSIDKDLTQVLSHGDGPQDAVAESSGGNIEEVHLSLVEIGDTLLVQTGEAVPIDGVICSQGSYPFDISSVTGESLPVTLHEGDELLTGTTAMKAVTMKVTSTASETLIDRIIRVVNDAQSKKVSGI